MNSQTHQKIAAHHLKRRAFVYVRQSTLRQVLENTESTERQYALQRRAVTLGWPADQVTVIDDDQGKSSATPNQRDGFQRLVAEVGMGHAGIVMGLEVQRLARNSIDWHRLLEICALTDTLILDEDGIYDATQFNDRLLLGLKGAMSEAELHVLRSRLRGGILNKARKGELWLPLPVGYVRDPVGRVVFDPDKQVQESVRLFFETFLRTGTAGGTVTAFRRQDLKFPLRLRAGPCKGNLVWGVLDPLRALHMLRNPCYAGAYAFGRSRNRVGPSGSRIFQMLPRDQWQVLLRDTHPSYVAWDQFEANLKRLAENATATGAQHRMSPPREGPALLQGLAICGVCGRGMNVRYHATGGTQAPEYVCAHPGEKRAAVLCQSIAGTGIDAAIGKLLLASMTPVVLEATLSIQHEIQQRIDQTDQLRHRHVERARYETEVARRRYMQVEPENRMVAEALETEWNQRLRTQREVEQDYEEKRQADRVVVDAELRARILALASDFPRLWSDPKTPHRERKRMVRLLIDDVTLLKADQIVMNVRFKGGATTTLTTPRPVRTFVLRRTPQDVLKMIDALLEQHTNNQIAESLNTKGIRTGTGKPFDAQRVRRTVRGHGLKSRFERLRERGLITAAELGAKMGVHGGTVRRWRAEGRLSGVLLDDSDQYMYEDPEDKLNPERTKGIGGAV